MRRRFAIVSMAVAFLFAVSAPAWAVPDPTVPGGVFKGTTSGSALDVSISKRPSLVPGHTVNLIKAIISDAGRHAEAERVGHRHDT